MSADRLVRQPHHQSRHHQHEHRRDDHPLAAEYVGDRAGERRGDRHRQRADGDDGGDLGRGGAEFLRQQRQDRLRGIEIDESAEAGEPDRQLARRNRRAWRWVHRGPGLGRSASGRRSYRFCTVGQGEGGGAAGRRMHSLRHARPSATLARRNVSSGEPEASTRAHCIAPTSGVLLLAGDRRVGIGGITFAPPRGQAGRRDDGQKHP